ncbi:MAG: sigma-70 family RNA polymerase sigma factor [Kiritimatiellae bacterium]|nr:sigma-70 family RNA polymerase sigma factor [Kiritimatiellia bacterium]
MSAFPETSATLLARLAAQATGEDEAAWTRFFELYEPAIVQFVKVRRFSQDPDDVVQEVFMRLVDVLRAGRFQVGKTPFRAYLATLIRNQLVSMHRSEVARGEGRTVPYEDDLIATPEQTAELLDLDWRLARRRAAIEHVLTRTAVSEQSKAVYRRYAVEERPIGEVAREFKLTRNAVSQIKTRLDRLVAAIEKEIGE